MRLDAVLHVVAVISNPVRYKSRYALFEKFKKQMLHNPRVKLWVVEVAYGARCFEVTERDNITHLQLRTWDELWHKENMINLGVQYVLQIAPDAEYIAWVDADVEFMDHDFSEATMHALQHHHVVQMWQNAVDLGPDGRLMATHHSFMWQYRQGKPYCYGKNKTGYYEHWHPGYAWAARREALDHLGGLIDKAILGAGDNHMAHALIGMLDQSMQPGLHANYMAHLSRWATQAERFIRRDVGFVAGTLRHHWHGKKKDRRYHDRWKILVQNQYDPEADLKRDAQGLYQLVDHGDLRSIRLRDEIQGYFRSRHEDSIDLE